MLWIQRFVQGSKSDKKYLLVTTTQASVNQDGHSTRLRVLKDPPFFTLLYQALLLLLLSQSGGGGDG